MAILKSTDIAPDADEQRHEIIAKQIIGGVCDLPGAVRGMAPLVMAALQLANNPYVTGARGFAAMNFEAMGIHFEEMEGKQVVNDPAGFGIAMMAKTAQVLVLVTCDNDRLKQFAVDSSALIDAALDYMTTATFEGIAAATVKVSEMLVDSGKSRVTKSAEDKDAPKASTLEAGKKKRVHTGSHKS